jgi:hypothetical protein
VAADLSMAVGAATVVRFVQNRLGGVDILPSCSRPSRILPCVGQAQPPAGRRSCDERDRSTAAISGPWRGESAH